MLKCTYPITPESTENFGYIQTIEDAVDYATTSPDSNRRFAFCDTERNLMTVESFIPCDLIRLLRTNSIPTEADSVLWLDEDWG